jgi:isopropylmalate/homocitrate/citramalate synthase
VIESPTSDIKLKAYGRSREEVLKRVTDAVRFARQNGITVAYFAVDGTRTELDFLKRVYLAALDAGASEIFVVDTIGACGPEAVEILVREVCQWVGPNVPVHYHGHNDFGMATPALWQPYAGRPGSRARSTAWATAPETLISVRLRWRCAVSTRCPSLSI